MNGASILIPRTSAIMPVALLEPYYYYFSSIYRTNGIPLGMPTSQHIPVLLSNKSTPLSLNYGDIIFMLAGVLHRFEPKRSIAFLGTNR